MTAALVRTSAAAHHHIAFVTKSLTTLRSLGMPAQRTCAALSRLASRWVRSARRRGQLALTVPSVGVATTDVPFPHFDLLLLTEDPIGTGYMVITESVIGLTTRASLEGHPAELVAAPSPLMHQVMGKGPLFLGGRSVARADGGEWPWERMIAIGAASTSVLTRLPSPTCLVARVRVWVCGAGRGGPRRRRLRDLLPDAASHAGCRADLLRSPSFVTMLILALNLPRGMRPSMPTAVRYTLARLRAPTCWPAWPLRMTFLLLLPVRILRVRDAAGTLLRTTVLSWEFEGVASRLGPRSSGEEARPWLPAAHQLASAGGPRAAEFEGGTMRLGRLLTSARSASSSITPWRSVRGLQTLSQRRAALAPVCASSPLLRSRSLLGRLGRLALLPLEASCLAATWNRAFMKSSANVN